MIHAAYMLVWVGGPLWISKGGLVARLTDRQCEILGMISEGLSTEQIEEDLDITRSMVRREIRRIRSRLPGGQAERAELKDLPGIAEWANACPDTEEAAA